MRRFVAQHWMFFELCADDNDALEVSEYTKPLGRTDPYVPALIPGARLPHFPIKVLQIGQLTTLNTSSKLGGNSPPSAVATEGMLSSIDLPALAAGRFLLFMVSCNNLNSWLEAIRHVKEDKSVEICPIVVVPPDSDGGSIKNKYEEDITVVHDVEGQFSELTSGWIQGAVLVRPDGHVAWRSEDGKLSVLVLKNVINKCLALNF